MEAGAGVTGAREFKTGRRGSPSGEAGGVKPCG